MIKDVKVVPLIAHVDDRGYLIEILRSTDDIEQNFKKPFISSSS